jgi:uncharacterized delta-60 repeat protein
MFTANATNSRNSVAPILLVSALGAALVALSLAIGPTSARADGSAGEVNPRFDTGSGLSSPNPPTAALAIAVPGDGNKSVVSGYFTEYQGKRAPGLIRLKGNGKRDKSFKPGSGPDGPVTSIVPLNDGKLLIGGNITTYNGQAVGNIARLNADGSLDTSYQPAGFNDQVSAMALLRNGSLLVAGFFTSYGSQAVTGGLVKLKPDATPDTSFAAPADLQPGSVQSLLKLKNGKALVGGTFPSYGSSSGGGLVQVNSDGSVDSEFDVGSGFGSSVGGVYSMQKYRRGFLIGGSFSQYDDIRAVNLVHVGTNYTVHIAIRIGLARTGNLEQTLRKASATATGIRRMLAGSDRSCSCRQRQSTRSDAHPSRNHRPVPVLHTQESKLAVGGQRRDCRGRLQPNRGGFAGTGIIRGPDLHLDRCIIVGGPGQRLTYLLGIRQVQPDLLRLRTHRYRPPTRPTLIASLIRTKHLEPPLNL